MPFIVEMILILLLILANGIFSMSEIAVVSSRRPWLQQRAQRGDRRARVALQLAEEPARFLSTVQVGITLVGVLTGAFGGATVADKLAVVFASFEFTRAYAHALAFTIVVVVITYLSLILGELVPKQLGLNQSERVAILVARPMRFLSILGAPIVKVLTASTEFVVWLLRIPPSTETAVTEDEIKIMLRQGAVAGNFEESERLMVESVFRLADWRVGALMTPRTEIEWLDPKDSRDELIRAIGEASHSRFPVADGSLDAIFGLVHAKELLVQCLSGNTVDLRAVAKPPLYVPESMRVLRLLEQFRNLGASIALVVDEYGSLEGLITLSDVMSAVVRDLPSTGHSGEEALAVQREDGSWLLDGSLPVDQFRDIFNLGELPEEDAGYYQTLGGLVMMQLGHIPAAGEYFEWKNLRLEVMDMDGHRVDKVLATPRVRGEGEADEEDEEPRFYED